MRYRKYIRYRLNIGVRVSPAGGLGSHKPMIRVVGRQEDVRGGTHQSGVPYQNKGENGGILGGKRGQTPRLTSMVRPIFEAGFGI